MFFFVALLAAGIVLISIITLKVLKEQWSWLVQLMTVAPSHCWIGNAETGATVSTLGIFSMICAVIVASTLFENKRSRQVAQSGDANPGSTP